MNPFLIGAGLALSLSLGVGPGLFLLFEASIVSGFTAGAVVLSGIYFSDLLLFIMANIGISQLLDLQKYQYVISLIGGIVLSIIGFTMIFKKISLSNLNGSILPNQKKEVLISYFIKGVLVNVSNPSILIFWMSIVGLSATNYGHNTTSFYSFFLGLFGGAICMDLLKSYFISKSHRFLNEKIMNLVNKTLGFVLVVIGIIFLCKGAANLVQ